MKKTVSLCFIVIALTNASFAKDYTLVNNHCDDLFAGETLAHRNLIAIYKTSTVYALNHWTELFLSVVDKELLTLLTEKEIKKARKQFKVSYLDDEEIFERTKSVNDKFLTNHYLLTTLTVVERFLFYPFDSSKESLALDLIQEFWELYKPLLLKKL